MKKTLAFTLIIFLFASSPASATEQKMPKGFYSDLNIRYEHCKKEKLEINAILCFAPPNVHNAYAEFTGAYGKTPNSQKALNYLKIQGLYRGIKQYEERTPYLKKLGVQNDPFFSLYQDASEWAEIEKKKSADELYFSAYNPDSSITDPQIMYAFLRAYLTLASEKGHQQAQKELTDITNTSWQKFLSDHGDEYPQLMKYKND